MSRSLKKKPYVEERLLKRIEKLNSEGKKQVLKTWSRSSTIYPEFVGHTIAVHNGMKHIPVYCLFRKKTGMLETSRLYAEFQFAVGHLPGFRWLFGKSPAAAP